MNVKKSSLYISFVYFIIFYFEGISEKSVIDEEILEKQEYKNTSKEEKAFVSLLPKDNISVVILLYVYLLFLEI